MLDFRTPTIEDRPRYQTALENTDFEGCDLSFANTLIWCGRYDVKLAFKNGFVFKSYFSDGMPGGYVMPFGGEDIRWAVNELLTDARERGIDYPLIGLLTEDSKSALQELFPDRFRFEEIRSDADYIYARDDLAFFRGRRYHAKRNHISQFKRMFPDHEYRELSPELFGDVLKITRLWGENKKQNDIENYFDDYGIVKTALDHFTELELFGGVLYAGGEPVAMTIASRIRGNICDIHFEKSVRESAYAVICNEAAKSAKDFEYINREEDMGIDGLRKSKLSYRPCKILTKYYAFSEKRSDE